MKYEKDYCEQNGISTSKLNEAQRTLYYIAENMRIGKSISEEGYRHFQMAIKALEQEPIYYPPYIDCNKKMDEIRKVYDNMAAKALEQEPCEDAISREELLKALDTWDKFGYDVESKLVKYQDHYIPYIHYDDVVKCIKGMPSITPKPKTGHWIKTNINGQHRITCSCCDYTEPEYRSYIRNFCPNCGAKMVESQESEE